jgi:predicted porin
MKKFLVALAAIAAFGSVSAQSSVTLYGRLDLGLLSAKTSNTNAANVTTDAKTFSLAGAQGVRTGPRLGVRGSEDLGGGLRAGFNFETRINPDASAADSLGGGARLGNITLSGGFGGIVIGTYLNAFDDVRGYSASTAGVAGGDWLERHRSGDALRGATIAALGLSPTTSSSNGSLTALVPTTFAYGLSGRSENGLGYRVNLGPVNLRASVSSERTDPGTDTTGYGLAAGYDNGPLSLLASFGTATSKAKPTGTTLAKINDVAFAVSYDLGIAKPYFQFENGKLTSTGPAEDKVSAFEIGAKFPLGALTPYVTFSGSSHKDEVGTFAKGRGFQIGTTYDISKRTYVYAAAGSDRTKGEGALSTNIQNKRNGFAAGLVHNF